MSKKPSGDEPLFKGVNVPGPPEELRAPALARARQAMEQGPRHDLWAQIWNSREARLAWAASVLVLAVCHFALPGGNGGQAGDTVQPRTAAQHGNAESSHGRSTTFWTAPGDLGELSVIIDLPRLIFDDRTIATSTPALREAEDDLDSATPPAESEENAS